MAVGIDEEPMDAGGDTRASLIGYRQAMTYVLLLSRSCGMFWSMKQRSRGCQTARYRH